MKEYCVLTGQEVTEKGIEPVFKKMCLNCTTCITAEDKYRCTNEKVMDLNKKKVLESLPEGFEVESITLKPMELKDPTKKCKNYNPNMELIETKVKEFFLSEEAAK
jgi:hypothetical protein